MEDGATHELPDSALMRRAVDLLSSRLHKRGLTICLSGIDGCGKTTLARELVHGLEASNVPARYLHLHQWYLNVSITPILLAYNRYFDRKVLVFDRSIYDNLAVASLRRFWPRWLSRGLLAAIVTCYPRFDYRFYLVVPFSEALVRRPDTEKERFARLGKIYDEIASRARYLRFQSDKRLFSTVLQRIARDV